MKSIKTLKSLYNFTQDNPDVEEIYVSKKLNDYINLLQEEYLQDLTKGIPMKKKHKEDYWLFNRCIICNGVIFKVKEDIEEA